MDKNKLLLALKRFKDQNQSKYCIAKIGFFGSAARAPMNKQRDVDIVVELETPDIFYLIGIKQDLEEKLQVPVDVVRYRKDMNPFLKRRIESEAIYV